MKLTALNSLIILITFLYPNVRLTGQANNSDSIFYQSAVYNTIAFYRLSAGDQTELFNGREYKPYRISFINGHPFFLSDQFAEGSIIYEDGLYQNQQLLYDEVQGMVILNTDVRIELITERIKQFTISGHTFIRLNKDSLNNRFIEGFYERLYDGKIEIYKKENKFIKEDLSETEGVRGEITKKNYYFLKKNGQYYPVIKKNNLFEILKDREKEIQQFIKNNSLDFRKDTDNTLSKIAGYYDQLTR